MFDILPEFLQSFMQFLTIFGQDIENVALSNGTNISYAIYWADNYYSDVIMSTVTSQITSLPIVCSTVYSGAAQRKYHSSAWLASNAENVTIWWRHHNDILPRWYQYENYPPFTMTSRSPWIARLSHNRVHFCVMVDRVYNPWMKAHCNLYEIHTSAVSTKI